MVFLTGKPRVIHQYFTSRPGNGRVKSKFWHLKSSPYEFLCSEVLRTLPNQGLLLSLRDGKITDGIRCSSLYNLKPCGP